MIRTIKESSLHMLKELGITTQIGGSAWRRRRLLILCYHGVSLNDEHLWDPGLYVPAEHLQRRLELLHKNRCNVLPLGEALERMYRKDLPDRAVVLTFDDGYHDFMAKAWPLLQPSGYPVTVYLTTGRVHHNLPIVNLLISYALWLARDRVLRGTGIVGLDDDYYALATAEQRRFVSKQISEALLVSGSPDMSKDSIAREIVDRLDLDYGALINSRVLTLMKIEDVTRLAREGVDFQLHTHLHRTPEDPEEFLRDVLVNAERIHAMTGTLPRHLCYPSGDYRESYLPVLRRAGLLSATTCDPDLATRGSDELLLPRFIDTSSVSNIVFEGWLTGVATCFPRRTRRGGDRDPLPVAPRQSWAGVLTWSGK